MPIPSGYVEVWFGFRVNGEPRKMFTHLAYKRDLPITQAAVNAGIASFQQEFRPNFAADTLLEDGHVIESETSGGIRWDSDVGTLAGSKAGSAITANTAVLVKKLTGSGGRRNRGRMFFPCPVEGDVNHQGQLTNLARSEWEADVAKLLPGGVIHTAFGFLGEPVLLHEAGSQTPTPITGLVVDPRVATQRRRLR